MKVLTKYKCPECNGVGVVANNWWAIFYPQDESYKKQYGVYMDAGQVDAWFKDKFACSKLPPEEDQCSECEGKGEIQQWLPLSEIIKLIQ